MQTGGMNKLAVPDCHNCGGTGKVQMPRGLANAAPQEVDSPRGQQLTPGFKWVNCGACHGTGRG